MAYSYQQLCGEKREIRLLTIEPSDQEDAPIHISLKHVSLDSEPEYAALSYTWGRPAPHLGDEWDDPQSTKSITVNNQLFHVRYNLHSALLALRKTWSSKTWSWWIDAICIDQSNTLERNTQVAIMKDIYASSSGTYTWLGPSDSTTFAAWSKNIALSKSWDSRPQHLRLPTQWKFHEKEIIAIFRNDITSDNSTQPWYALKLLAARSWFNRAWVVQETCVSPRTFIQCGDSVLTWEHLINAHNVLTQYAWCIALAADMFTEELRAAIISVILATYAWAKLNSIQIETRRSSKSLIAGTNLLRALDSIRTMNTTDLRDKVYAALGLAGTDGDLITVDYSLSATSVYIDVVKRSMMASQSFHFLEHCHYPPNMTGLPTWVPDWSDTRRNSRGYKSLPHTGHISAQGSQCREPLYRVSMGSAVHANFQDCGPNLIIKAGILDKIAYVASYKPPGQHRLKTTSQIAASHEDKDKGMQYHASATEDFEWLREWATSSSANEIHCFPLINRPGWTLNSTIDNETFRTLTYTPTSESLPDAYYRTLLADTVTDLNRGKILRLTEAEQSGVYPLQDDVQIAAHYHETSSRRRMAMSETGYLCLVSEAACISDVIAIAQGAELPFILREVSLGTFHFIGLAYVHGIMDGEVWDSLKDNLSEISLV